MCVGLSLHFVLILGFHYRSKLIVSWVYQPSLLNLVYKT